MNKSKYLRTESQKLIKKTRENPPYIYSKEEIKKSKYPNRQCQLCGQLGCDLKFAGQYLHKKCFRILKTFSKKIQKAII